MKKLLISFRNVVKLIRAIAGGRGGVLRPGGWESARQVRTAGDDRHRSGGGEHLRRQIRQVRRKGLRPPEVQGAARRRQKRRRRLVTLGLACLTLAIVLLALPGYLYLADPLIIKPKKQPKEA